MNQYRCETCKKDGCDNHPDAYNHYEQFDYRIAGIIKDNQKMFGKYGCASHSDFQNQKEKVLDDVNQIITPLLDHLLEKFDSQSQEGFNSILIKHKLKELRQVSRDDHHD